MPALYPVSVAAEDYQVGDNVKWFGDGNVSPYVGKVVAISPKTYKVYVTWPIGETRQHAPEELILVPKYEGMSVVKEDNGYSSYDKEKSKEFFGTMSPSLREKAASKVMSRYSHFMEMDMRMAAFENAHIKVNEDFAKKASEMVINKCMDLKGCGKSSPQAYEVMYEEFHPTVGDDLIKKAISLCYGE